MPLPSHLCDHPVLALLAPVSHVVPHPHPGPLLCAQKAPQDTAVPEIGRVLSALATGAKWNLKRGLPVTEELNLLFN